MTGNYILDVFSGTGFMAREANHVGLRGCVLDTKSDPRYDVFRGKCVAGMITPPRQHVSCFFKKTSACEAVASVLRALTRWILEHPCDSWGRAENPDSCGTASHGLGPDFACWITVQKADGGNWTAGWTLQCFWRKKHLHQKASESRSCSSSRDTRPPFSFSCLPWCSPCTHEDSREHIF